MVVRFVERYGTEVHKFCERKGFAPKLLGVEHVTSRYHMVVMEEVQVATTLHEYVKNGGNKIWAYQQCATVLTELHRQNFCHGDFRSNNILVIGDSRIEGVSGKRE